MSSLSPIPQPGSLGRPRIVDTNSLVFWVSAVAVVYSGIHLFSEVTAVPVLQAAPAIGWLALVQWTLYGIVFFAVVDHSQLFVRRPAAVIAGALVWGGVVATWFAAEANAALEDLILHWTSPAFADRWAAPLSAATNEEILKLLGVVVLALLPLVAMRSTLDGWFYGMMVGLGFQLFEDFLYTVQQSTNLTEASQFLVQRGLFAGLWAHAIYTGITGAGVGYFVTRRDKSFAARLGVAIGLFAVAWLFHFLWDAEFLNDWLGNSTGAFFATIAIKGVPALAVMMLVVRRARSTERPRWRAFVDQYADPAVLPAQQADELMTMRSRRAARRAARHAGGRAAGHTARRRQMAQLRYVQGLMEFGPNHPHTTTEVESLTPATID